MLTVSWTTVILSLLTRFRDADGQLSLTETRKVFYQRAIFEEVGDAPISLLDCACIIGRPPFNKPAIRTSGSVPISIRSALPLWAAANKTLPDDMVSGFMCRLSCLDPPTGDFDLAHLVRVLYLANDKPALQQEMIRSLQTALESRYFYYWAHQYEPDGTPHLYWTENHMMLWSSSEYLIRQFQGQDLQQTEQRILQWLNTKLEYGFYEFFSPVYYQLTAAGLLNLVDYATNPYVQDLASQTATKLLKEVLLFVNNEGSFYPACARGFTSRFVEKQFIPAIYFLGLQTWNISTWKTDYIGSFLATTKLNLEPIAASWRPVIDTEFSIGHGIDDLRKIHGNLEFVDRVMFYWSAGAYYASNFRLDTQRLVNELRYANHPEFQPGIIFVLPPFLLEWVAFILPSIAGGTDNSGATVSLFKRNGVVLSSLVNFRPRTLGGEVFPWMATVGDIAVWTQSGITGSTFVQSEQGNKFSNSHLPDVRQDGNVVLISYFPRFDIWLLNIASFITKFYFDKSVALYFPTERFDEVITAGNWIMGRRGNNFVGVWRNAGDTRKDCSGQNPSVCDPYFYSPPSFFFQTQVWAAVVGDTDTHGSFAEFCNIVGKGTVTGRIRFRFWPEYVTSVEVDGKRISGVMS